MTKPRFGSLFAGVGGFDLGLERAGWECAWQVEIDPFCRRVLTRHWPEVPRFTDIREVRGAELPPVDLICGGWPCQDVSVAGKRAGLAGSRSGLFHEMTRIVKEMRDATGNTRPAFVMGENVPGLLSSNGGRDFAAVLHGLADCGAVDVGWRILDARFFGVPQRRRRVFLVADFGAERAGQVLAFTEGVLGHPAAGGEAGTGFAGGAGDGTAYSLRRDPGGTGQGHNTNYVVDEEVAGTLGGGAGRRGWCSDVERMTFIPEESGCWTGGDEMIPQGQRVYRPGGVGPAMGQSGGMTPLLLEEPPAPAPLYYSHDYNQDRIYDPEGIAPAVCAQDSSGARQFLTGAAVRRLTPTECARLQGFPDDWNCLCGVAPYSTWTCTCPDGPRYASYGNAVAVPVVEWLGRRLLAVTSDNSAYDA